MFYIMIINITFSSGFLLCNNIIFWIYIFLAYFLCKEII